MGRLLDALRYYLENTSKAQQDAKLAKMLADSLNDNSPTVEEFLEALGGNKKLPSMPSKPINGGISYEPGKILKENTHGSGDCYNFSKAA